MSDFVVPQLPFLDLPRAVETIRAAGGWLHCEERDLITLWQGESIELCFSVPDWIASDEVEYPGNGRNVLLSVEPASFIRWWAEAPYDWSPPPEAVTMALRRYGTAGPHREQSLSAWAYSRLDFDYRPENDNGELLAEALHALYSEKALVIPRAELVKAIGIFTSTLPDDVRESCGTFAVRVHGNAEHHATNREQVLKVAIGVLADYPDECRGPKKDPSPAKWTAAILKHAKEYPPLILGKDAILDNLKEAVNLRSRTGSKGGE
ncbi:hypothetical protein GFJ62_00640 [Salmonella enterica subsp. diarizonae]|nr:hypothetical protein [Salmonella enterica subsp. diarizonae]EDT3043858.1 hypothetical protein [Salmonella enterica subsp. enterica serovar 6,7:k:-]EDX6462935.1 hypothetical protein [Salmonella enterica subsp. diarizonae serovar 60:r:e,n,x,z15]EJH0530328.1 hypothetical protein [Salmonella enterica]